MKPNFEPLEGRDNPSSVTLVDGTLAINIDYQSYVDIRQYGDWLCVSVQAYGADDSFQNLSRFIPSAPVRRIAFEGGSSYDSYFNGTTISDTVRGNGGDDILFGGGGVSVVDGGAGNDFVVGWSVATHPTLIGGAGKDGFHYLNEFFPPAPAAVLDFNVSEGDFTY